ncbi:hypothetical protein MAM1_0047c03190 [Mucor ambiguus]|uniref:Uncharacterized protein n=1 Tax=Mucor ambiguus TaxID=91626 RepID=A0A0C9LTH0_9FUNG|nr:hypothetical protein MAM1_0047c03190 [Mucor ambiguus]
MYATILQPIKYTHEIKMPQLPMDVITKILSIIQDVSTEIVSRDRLVMQLIHFDLPLQENRFVESIIRLMVAYLMDQERYTMNGFEIHALTIAFIVEDDVVMIQLPSLHN